MAFSISVKNLVISVGIIVTLLIGLKIWYIYGTGDTITVTINKRERVVNKDSSKYMIYTNKEVFQNVDSFLRFKFNSADVYNELVEGKEYTLKVYGFRWRFFSMFRNIDSIVKK